MPCLAAQFDPAVGPILGVIITPSGSIQSLASPNSPTITLTPLLVDTGADATCISPQVAQRLNLTAIGLRPVNVPSGQALLPRYLVDIGIYFAIQTAGGAPVAAPLVMIPNIEVLEFRGQSPHYQGLLGRDVLSNAHFSIAGWAKTFTICM